MFVPQSDGKRVERPLELGDPEGRAFRPPPERVSVHRVGVRPFPDVGRPVVELQPCPPFPKQVRVEVVRPVREPDPRQEGPRHLPPP